MSEELKTYDFPVDHGDFTTTIELFYLKSEADKVIEDKDGRIDLYKRGFEESDRINAHIYKELRHNKHKRCLEMARWCYSMDCRMLDEASDNGTYFKESWCWKRALWYGKWKRKWLELAEKFKEGT